MAQYWRIVCVMQAAGATLIMVGSLSLIFLYLIICLKPFCTLVCASKCRAFLAYVDLADVWGPCIIAANILSVDHAGTQFTVQPSV